MADGEIVLTRSTRGGVEKLDFDRRCGRWRVVMERPGAKVRDRPKEVVGRYAGPDEAWRDIAAFMKEGFKIALYAQ